VAQGRYTLDGVPIVTFGGWITSSLLLLAMLVFLYVVNFMEFISEDYKAVIIVLMIGTPIMLFGGIYGAFYSVPSSAAANTPPTNPDKSNTNNEKNATEQPQRYKGKYIALFIGGILVPLIILVPLYATLSLPASFKLVLLTIFVGLPTVSVIWMVIWLINDIFAMNIRVFSFIGALCCCFVFFPFGVLVPSVVVTDQSRNYGPGALVGVMAIMIMSTVCAASFPLLSALSALCSLLSALAVFSSFVLSPSPPFLFPSGLFFFYCSQCTLQTTGR
jgi:hypothetical protein